MKVELENNQLPQDWDIARIGDKFLFTGKPRDLRFDDFPTVPFVPMDRIPSDRLFLLDFVLKTPAEIGSGTYFEEGDLLLSKITPCFENGKQGIAVNIPGGFGIATTEVIPIKAIEGVSHLPFLAMYLLDQDVRNTLAGKMEGATGRQRLGKSVVGEWTMPFPSLPEQRAIAAVLSKIQAAMEVQEKIVATFKELKAFPIHLPNLSEEGKMATVLRGIDQEIDQHTNQLNAFKSLFSSMLHLLMTGQVRVNESRSGESGGFSPEPLLHNEHGSDHEASR